MTRHLIENENVVASTFKTVDTGEVVGAGLILPATCSRTTTSIITGGSIVVRPDFVSKGLGSVMVEGWQELAIWCGYDGVFCETHDKHTAMIHISNKVGMRMIGCIPGTIKLPISGWGDTVLFYMPFGRYTKANGLK